MKRSPLVKLALDGLMLGLVLVGFAYKLTGSIVHELLGLGLFGLFLVHGGWNWAWFRSLFKGRYSGLRWVGLTVNTLLLLSLGVAMVSGMLPVVGVPLPFISYGGTALVTLATGLGLLLSAAAESAPERGFSAWRGVA